MNFVFVVVIFSVRSVSSLLSSVAVNLYNVTPPTDFVSRKEILSGKVVNLGGESEKIKINVRGYRIGQPKIDIPEKLAT